MAFKIGFTADHKRTRCEESVYQARQHTDAPHPSVVQVYFESRDRSWTYYNDRFDLHEGDLVYVEGKLEGVRGRVVEVSYNFRIKLADYKRVIAVADILRSTGSFMWPDPTLSPLTGRPSPRKRRRSGLWLPTSPRTSMPAGRMRPPSPSVI